MQKINMWMWLARVIAILLLLNSYSFAQRSERMSLRNADIYNYKYMDSILYVSKYIYLNKNCKVHINYDDIVIFHDEMLDTISDVNISYVRNISVIGNWIIGTSSEDTIVAINYINKRIVKFYSFRHYIDGVNDSNCFIINAANLNNGFPYQILSIESDTLILSNKMYLYYREIGKDTLLVPDYFSDKFKFFNFARVINKKNEYCYHEIWRYDSLILRLDNGDGYIYSNYTDIDYNPDSDCFLYIQKHGQLLSGVISNSHTVLFSIRDTLLFPIADSSFLRTRDSIINAVKDSSNKVQVKKILYHYKKQYNRIVRYKKYRQFLFFEVIVRYPWSAEESEFYVYDLSQKRLLTKLQPVFVDE